LLITTIRVVSRANVFVTKGRVLKGMDMGLMGVRREPKLCIIIISTKGTELSKAMRSIRPRAQEGGKGEGFWFKMGEDVKRVS
jgi:hypothetical protein